MGSIGQLSTGYQKKVASVYIDFELLPCDWFYSETRLTVATQQTFLQVSQSGYANLINGHASLQSPTVKWRHNELLKTCRFVFYGLLVKKMFVATVRRVAL